MIGVPVSCGRPGASGGARFSGGGPGKAPVVSEKGAMRLLNLVPLRLFVERKRASKENLAPPEAPGRPRPATNLWNSTRQE